MYISTDYKWFLDDMFLQTIFDFLLYVILIAGGYLHVYLYFCVRVFVCVFLCVHVFVFIVYECVVRPPGAPQI